MPSHIISSVFTPTHVVSVKLFEFLFLLDQSCLQSNQQVLLYPITSCIISITACVLLHQNTCWRLHWGSLLCCSVRLCLGLNPTKICCQYPSWQTLACLNAFIVQEGFSNAEAWVHGRAFCHNTQMLFPSRDHNHWRTWHRPLVGILCVSVGGTEFKMIE